MFMRKLLFLSLILLLSSCIGVEKRREFAAQMASEARLQRNEVATADFNILTYYKVTDTTKPLNIYIEGDGYAMRSREVVSDNPTPINPVSLKIAAVSHAENILYIARPCQYVNLDLEKNCSDLYWTDARYSKKVVDAVDAVINFYQKKYAIAKINLFGFSGGGAIAVLVAAQRNDIAKITTIAAALNHSELSKAHNTLPIAQSLDPIDFVTKVCAIEQTHMAGSDDEVVLPYTIKAFVDKLNSLNCENKKEAKYVLVDGLEHGGRWELFIN